MSSSTPAASPFVSGPRVPFVDKFNTPSPLFKYEGGGTWTYQYLHVAGFVFGVPLFLVYLTGFTVSKLFWSTVIGAVPLFLLHLWALSWYSGPAPHFKNDALPGRDLEHYIDIKDEFLAKHYRGKTKIPMEVFFEAYFDDKIDLKGDCLEIFENRYDWATFGLCFGQVWYFLTTFIPDVILHHRQQDETQVRDHYDRGDDFYEAFLGKPMIYTSGIITDTTRKQSIDELQENKLRLVCEKLQLKPGERHLDIGCGWGTLAVYAAKHYKTQSTGVTLARNQTAYGNNRAKANKVDNLAKIICTDYRDVPATPRFNKISCLEMAEHVGIRRFTEFLTQVREMMDDDGLFFLQIAGLRAAFQFEDFVWGLFMNKYVFPGADASCPLNWVIGKLEHAGFEIRSTETLGVHYSATIHRWYENWMKNKDKMVKAYGKRWFHIWEIFLAWSTIVARQGNSTVFQIVAHKNRNAFDRTSLIKSDDNSPVRELSVI